MQRKFENDEKDSVNKWIKVCIHFYRNFLKNRITTNVSKIVKSREENYSSSEVKKTFLAAKLIFCFLFYKLTATETVFHV